MPVLQSRCAAPLCALFLALAVGAAAPAAAENPVQGPAKVVDGDTLEIGGRRFHMSGIDAPEIGQPCTVNGRAAPCGQLAARALAARIGDKVVACIHHARDEDGAYIAACHAGGENLNRVMVHDGWAVADRAFSIDYVAEEDDARAANRGIWQTEFLPPADWRAAQRGVAGASVAHR